MIRKVTAIILQSIKYSDSGIILRIFTREIGGVSVIVKGVRKRGSGKNNILFQPMNILNMEVVEKPTRDVQFLKECTPYYLPTSVREHVDKSCISIFLGEVLTALICEGDPNVRLFDYIERNIRCFDKTNIGYSNFHIIFLAQLCSYIGIEPNSPIEGVFYFDLINGRFVPIPPSHGGYLEDNLSYYLAKFFFSSTEEINSISLNGLLRKQLLDALLKYISLHIPFSRQINSLEIMREIFA